MLIILILASVVGLSLGLLGGGGSILAVPVLTYGAGLGAKEAIATSLLVVGTTSFFALLPHAKRGNVEWRVGSLFAVTAMVGAFLGGLAAGYFSGKTLLLLFAIMMVVTALAMFNGRKEIETTGPKPLPTVLIVVEGLLVGGATGLVGAGGGFLVVPALVLLGGMEMHKAVGTSLLVISVKSFSAYLGYVSHVSVDFELAVIVTSGAVLGSVVGGLIAPKLSPQLLRKSFSIFVLAMAAYVVWREVGLAFVGLGSIFVVPALFFIRNRKKRRSGMVFETPEKTTA